MTKLTETNALFSYSERVQASAESFLRLKDKFSSIGALELGTDIASEWQVERLDMDEKVWDLKRDKEKESLEWHKENGLSTLYFKV